MKSFHLICNSYLLFILSTYIISFSINIYVNVMIFIIFFTLAINYDFLFPVFYT